MNEEQEYLIGLLQNAVNSVYKEERFLLRFAQGHRKGLEQAFVFRTGVYLSNLLNNSPYANLDLDSEYNKYHGNPKTSSRFPNGLRPDLILHRRDANEDNKLVAEFKGWWNNRIDSDIRKLKDLTDQKDDYHYLIGVFVLVGNTEAKFRYFINGQEHQQ